MIRRLTPILLLLTGACAGQTASRYPSLLPRPIESRSDAEPVAESPVLTPDPALDTQAADAGRSIAASHSAFAAAAARAEIATKAAKGDPVGSERWIAAQTALAELDGYRADSLALLTDLEQAAINRAAAGQPPYPALETAHAAVQAEFDAQTATITTLSAQLPQA